MKSIMEINIRTEEASPLRMILEKIRTKTSPM